MANRNKQSSLIEQFKRAAKHAASIKPESEVSELNERLRVLTKNYSIFEKVQEDIEAVCGNDDELNMQYTTRTQVETWYYSAYGVLKASIQAKTVVPANADARSNLDDVKLPRINLTQFSGKYGDWISFKDLFTSLIHERTSLTGAQKLHYLKTNLSGDAAQLIKSFHITDANYAEAWKLLLNRFDNKRYIIDAHLKTFFAIPKCSNESASGIKRILDESLEVCRSLLALGVPVNTWDTILLHVIAGKLDTETHRQWELGLKRDSLPTFKDMVNFLEARYQSLEMVTSVKPKQAASTHKNTSSTVLHVRITSCSNCKLNHEIYKCPDYKNLSIDQRFVWLREKNLCSNCLRSGHSASSCTFGSCRVCGKRHHSSLHRAESTPIESQTSTSVHFGNSAAHVQILLATAQVNATNSCGKTKSLRALIDPGSQSTLITEAAAQSLLLPRETSKICVRGLGSSTVGCTNGKVSLKLSSLYDPKSSLDISAHVLPQISDILPSQHISVGDSWSHLMQIPLADPAFNKPNPIDILIGSDIFGDLIQDGLIKGQKGAPVAQKTMFGWVLSGPTSSSTGR